MSDDSLFGIPPFRGWDKIKPTTLADLKYEDIVKQIADSVEGFPHLMAAIEDLFPKAVDDVKAELASRTQRVGKE